MRRASSALLLLALLGCRVSPSFETRQGTGGGLPGAAAADDGAAAEDGNGRGGTTGSARGGSGASKAMDGGGTSSGGSSSKGGSAPTSGGAQSGGDSPGSGGEAGGDSSTGGAVASDEPNASNGEHSDIPRLCDAQSVTFDELRAGDVRDDVKVRLDAVATSQKFLVSHAKSGSCLFGAFLGTDPADDGPRGVLVVSFGLEAPEGEPCAPGHDAIPDDLAPGDSVSGVGYLAGYAPPACDGIAPSPQLMVDAGCPLSRDGRRMLPAPYDLDVDTATELARGTDAALVRRFAGGLVRLRTLHTLAAEDGVGSVGPYGVVRFAETTLELHNDLEYGDLTLGGPGDAAKSLEVPYPATFESVTGVVYLDYCTWAVTPRSRCEDLEPMHDDCR